MSPRTLFLLLLPLLALGVWWALTRGPGADHVATPLERGANTKGEGPVLEATQREGTATGEPRVPGAGPPTAGEAEAARVRIYGEVILHEGIAAGEGLVALLALNKEPERVIARHALSDGLAFQWSVPYEAEAQPWSLKVVMCVPGLPLHGEEFNVNPGGEHKLTLRTHLANESENDMWIEGRVTDHRGRPLEGFRFALTGSGRWMSGSEVLGGIDDLLRIASKDPWIVARTGADGRFEAHAHVVTGYWPVSLVPKWVVQLSSGHVINPRQGPVLLTASPAARVRGHVRDAATGKPLESHMRQIYVSIDGRLAGTYGLGDGDPDFDWATSVTAWGPGRLEIELQVRSRLYEPFTARLHPGPDGFDEVLDVALRPLSPSEIAELVVVSDMRDAQGRPVDLTLGENEEREGMRSVRGLSPERPGPEDEGQVYRMGSGTYLLSATMNGRFGMLLRWKGQLTLPGGRRTVFHVPWPPHGSLRVRHRPRAEDEERLSFHLRHSVSSEGVGHSPEAGQRETLIPALPVGTWVLTDQSQAPPAKHTLEVVAGTETVLDLDP